MSDLAVGLSTGCFYQTRLVDCLDRIRHAGFEAIEVCSLPSHLDYHDLKLVQKARHRMDDLGIRPYSFHAPFAETIDITALDARKRDTAIAELRYAVEAAATIGVRFMVVHPGPERGGFPEADRAERLANAVTALDGVAETCRQGQMTLAVENMLPHLFLGGADDFLQVVKSLTSPNVGICLDTGHAFLAGNLRVMTETAGRRLRLIHAHDNLGHYDDHLPPGAGKIPWRSWWTDVAAIGYHGPIILEIAGHPDLQAVLKDAVRGQQFIRRLATERTEAPE
ncbi:MAG: sugar phosphate isomerase/epimerase family protein [Thermoguttaceae bacterium]